MKSNSNVEYPATDYYCRVADLPSTTNADDLAPVIQFSRR